MDIKDIAFRINYFRNKLGISAKELSTRIGMHSGYINKLECHSFNLPTKMLLLIIEKLEITEAEFFSSPILNDNEKSLINNFRQLSDNNQNTILDLVNKLK
ncbi:MAG: helix-turn-helix domain-containing protein [Christensenellales bacterium]